MPISRLTPEEEEGLRKARAVRATESADLIALLEMLPRATSAEERHQLERMIARRGGPAVATCKCGKTVVHGSGLNECSDCYARGYGK
jgi:hypothetical protein